MNQRPMMYLSGLGILVIFLAAILTYQSSEPVIPTSSYNPAFNEYLSSYTAGEISRKSPVVIRFAFDMVDRESLGKEMENSPFEFEPALKGTTRWLDTRTIEFRPEEMLPTGKIFEGSLNLKQLISNVPEQLESFSFHFGTRRQDAKVMLTGVKPYAGNTRYQQITGIVKTVDYESTEKVESLLEARLGNSSLNVKWNHKERGNEHYFVVDSLERGENPYQVSLLWNMMPLNLKKKGKEKVDIAPLNSFQHLQTYTYHSPDNYVVLEFSDPLDKSQDLTGLIEMENVPVRFMVDANQIKVYPTSKITGNATVTIQPGILSASGKKLSLPSRETIIFSETEPEVRMVGKGTILPKSDQTLPFIFEAIGLKAVDVRVIKIFEENIPQFLQVNQLDGSRELKRVGQIVAKKKISLDANKELNLNQWNRHSLDLSSLIDADPGAIYEVSIGYRKSYSYFTCAEDEQEEDKDMLALEEGWFTYVEESEDSYWDYYYDDYDDRDNPCKQAYYNTDRIARRNVLASDLGLIAKSGSAGSFYAVTDLKTTSPVSGAKLEVYDYQNQLITTATTDSKGMVKATFDRKPYLMVAKLGSQRGYLRLDDGSALSMSRFDTQGKKYHKGVKGFIYGERGVWRPGDPIFLTFILEDKEKSLPEGHPVKFELINPRGQVVEKMVRTDGEKGFYPFPTQTDADAPTGNYLAKVTVGGAVFTETIKVEAIVPNRLKLALDFGVPYLSKATYNREADLEVRWLHGAIAKNLKADIRVTLKDAPTAFAGFGDYNFTDPVRKFSSEEKTLFDGNLNEEGMAKIPAKISVNADAPGMLVANFKGKVFEAGGGFSVDRFSMPYHPYETYVGIKVPKGDAARNMLLTDVDHDIRIATVNNDGKRVTSKVEVTLYKLDWKWWWDKSEDNIGTYQGKVNAGKLQTATINTANGEGVWKMNVKYPEWGRYLVRAVDENGHATGKIIYIDWPGWAGRSTDNERGGAQMLNFTSDKPSYKVGENIKLNIPSGGQGRALVSVETGTRVISAWWVEAKEGGTDFSFPATADMAPNIYVNISLLQPHAQTANDRPIRLYGVIPVKVENPATHLTPVLAMPDKLEPNSNFVVKVSEKQGKPMTYTVAVVDEGLLGLTRFQTPSPWHTFYQREALDVKTWDIYDHVLGAFGGEVRSMLSIGGGADSDGPEGKKPDRFKPVVKYLGPFELKAGETASHSIDMPNYIGEVRTMVVAGTPEGAYGSAEKSTPVKKPLMVLGTLPRVLGPGERVELPVTIFALEDNIKAVNVSIQTSKHMLVEEREQQIVRFNDPGEKMATFSVSVLSTIGKGNVKITVSSGGHSAVYETDIEIRTPNPEITDVYASSVESGKEWNQNWDVPGMRGTNNGGLEVSSMPPLNLGKRLDYLIRYPYGCIEQTTSGVFPQVYLTRLLELSPGRKTEVDKNIKAGIHRLKSFQVADGGLAYWPGAGEANEWGTNYAGHFLLEAEKAGYSVPADMMTNWKNYQKTKAGAWDGKEDESAMTQAYRLYLLALAGDPELGAMNRMRQKTGLYSAVMWNLAAAYYLAGQQEVALKMVKTISKEAKDYQELNGTFGSKVRDQAVILQALSIMDQRKDAGPLVKAISDRLSNEKWMNTQETAYSLVAMAKYAGEGGVSSRMKFSYRLDSGKWQDVNTDNAVWQMDFTELKKGKLEFKNKGNSMVYPRMIVKGIPQQGDTTNAANGVSINIRYTTLDGKLLDVTQIEQGTDFIAKVMVKNTGNTSYYQMAIHQIFPSGWEVHNTRLDGSDPGGVAPEYQDVRDDRVYTFYDLKRGSTKTFHILLNASYLGKYYLPTVTTSAMYDESIHAREAGQWVQVVQATSN